jgi:hypothetical protein
LLCQPELVRPFDTIPQVVLSSTLVHIKPSHVSIKVVIDQHVKNFTGILAKEVIVTKRTDDKVSDYIRESHNHTFGRHHNVLRLFGSFRSLVIKLGDKKKSTPHTTLPSLLRLSRVDLPSSIESRTAETNSTVLSNVGGLSFCKKDACASVDVYVGINTYYISGSRRLREWAFYEHPNIEEVICHEGVEKIV